VTLAESERIEESGLRSPATNTKFFVLPQAETHTHICTPNFAHSPVLQSTPTCCSKQSNTISRIAVYTRC